MTVTDTTDLARNLMGLDHAAFRKEVDSDLRPGDGERWKARHRALRSPTCVDRWFMVLSQMAKSVDGQLAAKADDYEAARAETREQLLAATDAVQQMGFRRRLESLKAEYSRNRANTLRFKSGLDEALIEARALRDSVRDRLYDSVVAEERNRYAARVTTLEEAIRDHQDAFTAGDIDPEPHDLHLWDVIPRKEA